MGEPIVVRLGGGRGARFQSFDRVANARTGATGRSPVGTGRSQGKAALCSCGQRAAGPASASWQSAVDRQNHPRAVCRAGQQMDDARRLRDIVEDPDSRISPEIVDRILRGKQISSADYLDLLKDKHRMMGVFEDQFYGFDALIAPATPFAAPRLEEVDEGQTPLSTFGRFVNMLDMCAISIPIGLTARSLPIGLQIAAPKGHDASVLRVAVAIEVLRGGLTIIPES